MRAVRAAQFGGPEVLKVENDVPIPEPAKGQQTRFRCKLCNDDYTYRRRSGVLRHLQEQHSGFTYKCSICGRMLSRAQTHVKCNARSSDMILFHRETGLKGAEAQRKFDLYQNEQINNHWEEVLPSFNLPEMLSPLHPSPVKRKAETTESMSPPPKRTCQEEEVEESAWEDDPTDDITLDDDIKSLVSEPDPRFKGIFFQAPTRLSDSPSTVASSPHPEIKSVVHKVKCQPINNESLFDFKNLEKLNKEKDTKIENSNKKRSETDTKSENSNRKRSEKGTKHENSTKNKCEKDTKAENSTKQRGEKDTKIENSNKKRSEMDTKSENSNKKRSEKGTKHENSTKNKCEKDTKAENSTKQRGEKDTKIENSDKKLSDKDTRTENCNKTTSERDTKKHNHDISEKDRSLTSEIHTKTENSTVNQNLNEKNSKTENSTTKITNKQKSETDTKTQNYNHHSVKPNEFESINTESGLHPSERGASISVMDDLYLSDSDDIFTEDMDEFQISEKDVDMDTEGYHRLIREVVKLNHREATPVVPIQKEQLCNPVLKKVVYQTFKFYQKTQEKRVLLNIGGKVFQTSRVTLKADPTSVFAVMFRRGCPFRPYARDTYYFDRDPSHFRFILNYLRNGGYLDIMTLPHEKKYLLELLQEARFYMLGGLEELIVQRLRQVLVEVKAASVNPIDTYIRTGNHSLSAHLPYIPGFDMAGMVKTIGPDVTRFKPGDRVYAVKSLSGSSAEYSVADQNMMGHLHDNLTFEQGAGLGIAYYTAYRSVVTQGNAQPGQSILIHGASGGVGLACVQVAKASGLTVYGTAGTQEGIELVLKQGATAAFNHREEGYSKKIMDATKGTGPDIIVEMMANKNIDTDIDIINKKGIILIVGSGGSYRVNKQALREKECKVTDISILKAPVADYMKMHEAMSEGMKAGWLQPHVGKVYPFEEAGLAHDELMNSGKSIGKRILRV